LLHVERSHRTEALFDGLAARLGARGRDPLAPAVVVVQGAGMERWLAQRLADRHGVCANVAFPFPRPFLEQVFAETRAERLAAPSPWDLEGMTFAVAGELADNPREPDYAVLVRSLAGADGDWRRIQLAHRIASVFDQSITFRPDWIRAWEGASAARPPDLPAGPEGVWQRRLFLAVRARLGPDHIAQRTAAFLAALGRPRERDALAARLRRRFPDAVELFAVSTLPPLHLEAVRGLASVVDVRLSVLTPSRAYFAELGRELSAQDEAAGGG